MISTARVYVFVYPFGTTETKIIQYVESTGVYINGVDRTKQPGLKVKTGRGCVLGDVEGDVQRARSLMIIILLHALPIMERRPIAPHFSLFCSFYLGARRVHNF